MSEPMSSVQILYCKQRTQKGLGTRLSLLNIQCLIAYIRTASDQKLDGGKAWEQG